MYYYQDQAIIVWVTTLVIVGALNLVLSFVVGSMAAKKGRSYGGFWAISFFFSFIVGFIAVALISPSQTKSMSVTAGPRSVTIGPVQCPFCKEQIRPDAVICKHCGKDVEPTVIDNAIVGEAALRDENRPELAAKNISSVIYAEHKILVWQLRISIGLVVLVTLFLLFSPAQFSIVGIILLIAGIAWLLIVNSKISKIRSGVVSRIKEQLNESTPKDQGK